MEPLHLPRTTPPARRRFGAWQVELTTRCPLRCRMCIRRGEDGWRSRDMTAAEFARLAPHLGDVETLVLQGWGEPLLHRELVDVIRRAKRGGPAPGDAPPAVGFVTSGAGLDARYAAALVAAGVDFIGFSVAGAAPATHAAVRVGSELDEVLAAAEHVAAARRRDGRGTPRTHLVFLALRDNLRELPALPALAARVGCGELVVTNLVQVVDAWQDEQKAFGREEPRGAYEAILAETGRRARARGVALRRAGLSPATTPICEEDPLRNLYVTADGEVAPCVYLCPPVDGDFTRRFGGAAHHLARLSFGNALRAPVAQIWDAPAYAAFRDRFARRARAHRLRLLSPAAWRRRADGSGDPLPEPPAPCRTCHKLLGA